MDMKRMVFNLLLAWLFATLTLVSCGRAAHNHEGTPNPNTPESPLRGSSPGPSYVTAATTIILPDPTQTPEPPLPDSVAATAPLPEYVRLDFEDGIVVAFADDASLGRVAYVTHVPSGSQAMLDAEGSIVDRKDSSHEVSRALDEALVSGEIVARITTGLQYDGPLPRNPIADWINLIRFDGITYSLESDRSLDLSHLGVVLYRVAFSLDDKLIPSAYQIRDGDATYLEPGTAIYSLVGYDPSLVLAALVDGVVLLYEKRP